MYYMTLPLSLATILSQYTWYRSKENPNGHQGFFPTGHHYKRDVYKTVERTPLAANKVSCYRLS